MSNLIVVTFKKEDEAEKMLGKLGDLQKQELIKVEDAARLIVWSGLARSAERFGACFSASCSLPLF
jgi:uncharacterized membrane protein